MTKYMLYLGVAIGSSFLPLSAQAEHASHNHQGHMTGSQDPCVLGSSDRSGACVGPVRVAAGIMSQGPLQPGFVSHPQAPIQMSGCVPGYLGPRVPCHGNWVPAPTHVHQPEAELKPHYAPAPQFVPAPEAYAPQPQQIALIPTSFFTGGITYGAGFATHQSYGYGGGGYAFSSGGTRFSGVRERSPTPLVPPPMRPRHVPPAHHHPGNCC